MSKLIVVLIVSICCCISFSTAQTFQYSRGWTNGKRSSQTTAADNMSSLRQMTNPLLMTANELNNRERLLQHIIKNPCDVRAALLSSHNFKLPNEDYPSSAAAVEFLENDDAVNRFKRELEAHH
ncbi:hypothetical protein PVAND_000035 [Polypedilum vanderplanki]|uniref:Pro-corazonin n=1 Tax=Polypedilum vanderplanki TaxID=319348 RepID=A0A9J6BIU5_POLVA|nr:hypothetical protein PVAND_000035 [Polypedilum vanderplanki]